MELYWNSRLFLYMTLRILDMPSDEQSYESNYYTGGNSVTVHYRVVLLRRRYTYGGTMTERNGPDNTDIYQ